MHDKGITVRQLAEETGYAISTVSQTINGRYSRRNYQAIVSRINRVLGTEGLPERIHTPSDEWCQSVKIGLIRKNMSVSQLAEASGVTRDKMSHVINGRMMDCQVVDTVSRLLGIALPGQLQECLNSMYNEDIRGRLVKKGVPEGEVAFIHSANTDARKSELFAKVRSGQVRFLLGSTQKMGGGAGTNVQGRLIALHHLDIPWCPAEEERARRYIEKSVKQGITLFSYEKQGI